MKKAFVLATTLLLGSNHSFALDLSLPDLGDYSSSAVSISDENRIGDYMLRQLQGSGQTLNDPALDNYLSELIYDLAPYAQLPDPNVHVLVMRSTQLNAFAIPGGLIGVNAGLLKYVDNQDQLASVLAHELSHLSLRHYAQQVTQQEKERPFWIASMVASAVLGIAAGAQAGGAAISSSMAAQDGHALTYSRMHEEEADRRGLSVMAAAGFDPEAMPEMLKKLEHDFNSNTTVPEFLLTHPLTQNRVADAEARAAQYPQKSDPVDPRFLMMQARANVLANKASQQILNYYRSRVANLPDNAGAHYGYALTELERKEGNNAASSIKWLETHQSNDLSVQTLRARYLEQTGKPEQGLDVLNTYWGIFPGNLIIGTELARMQEEHGHLEDARKTLLQLSQSHPEVADVWYNLSEVEGRLQHIIAVHESRIQYFMHTASWELAKKQIRYARNARGLTKEDNDVLDAMDTKVKNWEGWEKSMR
ncbi:M48 family metalloprotease [Pokkaliibacter sp. CJK22405]|uniref:M48 family metalloprotease n=1 Tax=Pokkaliibacter sp. CJK22405 TaxID=3384615 RepID=UPI003984F27C